MLVPLLLSFEELNATHGIITFGEDFLVFVINMSAQTFAGYKASVIKTVNTFVRFSICVKTFHMLSFLLLSEEKLFAFFTIVALDCLLGVYFQHVNSQSNYGFKSESLAVDAIVIASWVHFCMMLLLFRLRCKANFTPSTPDGNRVVCILYVLHHSYFSFEAQFTVEAILNWSLWYIQFCFGSVLYL